MIVFFVLFIVGVVVFVAFIFKLVTKSKEEEWYGKVVDKQSTTFEDDNGIERDYFYLEVKRDNGNKHKVGLSRSLWERFEIGDQVHKAKGELYPEKI